MCFHNPLDSGEKSFGPVPNVFLWLDSSFLFSAEFYSILLMYHSLQ